MALLTGLALLIVAGALLAGAVWALRAGERAALRHRVGNRFREVSTFAAEAAPAARTALRGTPIDRWLWRGGLKLTGSQLAGAAAGIVLATVLAWKTAGIMAAAVFFATALFAGIVWPQVKYRRRAAAMVSQIPVLLDQVVRGLSTGRGLDGALRLAMEETRPPLSEALAKAQQAVDLGAEIPDALRDAARLYGLRELHLVAMAVQIARGYGSSPNEMLESVVNLVRHREQAQRELSALTGETRVSAWLLSLLPSGLALYMVAVNPDYIQSMWYDETGRTVLLTALAMQAAGAFILWRMAKSV